MQHHGGAKKAREQVLNLIPAEIFKFKSIFWWSWYYNPVIHSQPSKCKKLSSFSSAWHNFPSSDWCLTYWKIVLSTKQKKKVYESYSGSGQGEASHDPYLNKIIMRFSEAFTYHHVKWRWWSLKILSSKIMERQPLGDINQKGGTH